VCDKSGVERDGFTIGIGEHELLGTRSERRGSKSQSIHFVYADRRCCSAQGGLHARLEPTAADSHGRSSRGGSG